MTLSAGERRGASDHPPPNHSAFHGEFVSQTVEAELRGFFGNAADLVHHRSGADDRGPVFRFPFSLTHTGFERNRRDRLVGEDTDVEFTFGTKILLGGNTAGFDNLSADPTAFERLKTKISESDGLAARGLTSYTPSLYFSMFKKSIMEVSYKNIIYSYYT